MLKPRLLKAISETLISSGETEVTEGNACEIGSCARDWQNRFQQRCNHGEFVCEIYDQSRTLLPSELPDQHMLQAAFGRLIFTLFTITYQGVASLLPGRVREVEHRSMNLWGLFASGKHPPSTLGQ